MYICANHAFMYRILKVMENLKISGDFKIVMSKTVNVMEMYKYDHLIGRSVFHLLETTLFFLVQSL